jgi:hypothetical protein
MRYTASCHCGGIGYELETQRVPAEWNVRACQCTFCVAHAALSVSDPQGTLWFRDESAVRYRFGLATADFLLCGRCGVYIGAHIATPRGEFGIINTRPLGRRDLPAAEPMVYDGEDPAERARRREERWTPVRRVR